MRKGLLGVMVMATVFVAAASLLAMAAPSRDTRVIDLTGDVRVTLDVTGLIETAVREGSSHLLVRGSTVSVHICEAGGMRTAVVDLSEAQFVIPEIDFTAVQELGLEPTVKVIVWKAEAGEPAERGLIRP